ncbi:MAG TPA: CbiX/SirB N-terminal domain-containing protein [Burkholderiales bacterium]|nr:CbiX/SirB N-terminal domain-containing protein [Burkholderiales bacterium]
MTDVNHALVLFAHGARDPQWAEPFRIIRDRIAGAHPGVAVVLAFLEIMDPSLGKAVDSLAESGVTRITLTPLFMAQGGHLKEDLPKIIATIQNKHPGLTFNITPPIGEVDTILDAIANWVNQVFVANDAR